MKLPEKIPKGQEVVPFSHQGPVIKIPQHVDIKEPELGDQHYELENPRPQSLKSKSRSSSNANARANSLAANRNTNNIATTGEGGEGGEGGNASSETTTTVTAQGGRGGQAESSALAITGPQRMTSIINMGDMASEIQAIRQQQQAADARREIAKAQNDYATTRIIVFGLIIGALLVCGGIFYVATTNTANTIVQARQEEMEWTTPGPTERANIRHATATERSIRATETFLGSSSAGHIEPSPTRTNIWGWNPNLVGLPEVQFCAHGLQDYLITYDNNKQPKIDEGTNHQFETWDKLMNEANLQGYVLGPQLTNKVVRNVCATE